METKSHFKMASETLKSAWKVIPMFHSRSISRTVTFYTEILGFELASVKPEEDTATPPEWIFCSIFIGKKAEANFYFEQVSEDAFHPSRAMVALGTEELDSFYDYVKKKMTEEAVVIAEEIEDTPWGFRQFAIQDPDGNLVTFFKFLEGGNPGGEEEEGEHS